MEKAERRHWDKIDKQPQEVVATQRLKERNGSYHNLNA